MPAGFCRQARRQGLGHLDAIHRRRQDATRIARATGRAAAVVNAESGVKPLA
jgi:hypothetical protein